MRTAHTFRSSPLKPLMRFLFAMWALFPTFAEAEPNWPILKLVPVERSIGVSLTVDIQNAADGSNRLFLVQQDGVIRIFQDGVLVSTPFLDISSRTVFHAEQGLLGLAFPPDFAEKQCFYVYYTRHGDGSIVLSRFHVSENPDVADPDSEEILLVIGKFYPNHNGGQIAFDPDGYFYIAVGDGGNQGDPHRYAQDLTNLLGKVLRIDVEDVPEGEMYSIPASNPFVNDPVYRPEILLWGLRNPWRFSFDPQTGDLFIADVGEASREEVNFIPSDILDNGVNLGWSIKEGTLDFQDHEDDVIVGNLHPPIFEYEHYLGRSVTGGHIYRGSNPRLYGFYFFADYISGRIWAMQHPQDGGQVQLLAQHRYWISTFGKDEGGEIYFANYYDGVYRIEAEDTLPPPIISPAGGLYTGGLTSTLWTGIPGAVLRYTTDGSDPDESSPVYVSPIQIAEPQTIKARAFRSDLNPSEIVEVDYQLRPATVQIITPPGQVNGHYIDYVSITLAVSTPGAEIRYTLDGTAPTQSSLLYSDQSPIFLQKTTQIRAVAFRPGWQPSPTAVANISLRAAPASFRSTWHELHEPVDLFSLTPNAVIHYTTDGTAPTLQSPVWNGPQDFPSGTTIRTLTVRGEMATGSATLKVVHVLSQKATFYRLHSLPNSTADIVQVDDNTFYSIGGYQLWKTVNGTSTQVHAGGFAQIFRTVRLAADSKLIVADQGTASILQYLPPLYGEHIRWGAAPTAVVDTAPEPGGSLLLVDANHRIRRITGSSATSVIAGTGVAGGQDGPAAQATFDSPIAIARDSDGNIFVAEQSGRRLRKIRPDNIVTTVAGTGADGWLDGPATSAMFESPRAMVLDRIGNVYISERVGAFGRIRKIRPDGMVTTLRGPVIQQSNGSVIASDSLGAISPHGLDVDENGVLYFANNGNWLYKVVQEDWDNDGIPDAIETALGEPYVVGVDDRFIDSDGDQISNSAEWINGTDPLVPDAPSNAASIALRDNNSVSLSIPCEPGTTYQLEYSDDLTKWNPMGVPFVAQFRSFTTLEKRFAIVPSRYYRLREVEQ